MNKKGFELIEGIILILVIILLIGIGFSFFSIGLAVVKCDDGDLEACKNVPEHAKENKCIKELNSCNYDCANDLSLNISDCTTRCSLKNNYCKNK
jgi:hypothetical protein